MTNYDKLIDAISQEIYKCYNMNEWNESVIKNKSRKILEIVEEFQELKKNKI